MVLRTLIAATPLLAAACFVDNRPVGGSASVVSDADTGNDPATGDPTTTGSPGTSSLDPTTTTTTTTTTATTTTAPDASSTSTSESATSEPATTGPITRCESLANFAGAVTLAPCAECVADNCCDAFDACADKDHCLEAWSCIALEPCDNKWPACPGAIQSILQLQKISACVSGPCVDVCQVPCVPQTSACEASPACVAVEACLGECPKQCDGMDLDCLGACASACFAPFPGGEDLWIAKNQCQNPDC